MAKNYRLESVQIDHRWEKIVESSPDATIFMMPEYLKNVGVRIGLYLCYNSNELRAAVAVAESFDGTSAIQDDLLVYSGICFGDGTHRQTKAQRNSERYEMGVFLAGELDKRYNKIEFNLAPSLGDVRPFLWHNYGKDERQYIVDVRYTSYLQIADFSTASNLEDIRAYHDATGSRRQQIRYAKRDGVVTEEFLDVDLFIDFYRKTMQRQGHEVPLAKADRMAGLIHGLLDNDSARMFVSKTNKGVAGSVAVYAFDSRRAYYLFGASDPEMRSTPTGTAVLWDAFKPLAEAGLTEIDLEGVNSPHRGWFKLSFGGDLRSYFQIKMV